MAGRNLSHTSHVRRLHRGLCTLSDCNSGTRMVKSAHSHVQPLKPLMRQTKRRMLHIKCRLCRHRIPASRAHTVRESISILMLIRLALGQELLVRAGIPRILEQWDSHLPWLERGLQVEVKEVRTQWVCISTNLTWTIMGALRRLNQQRCCRTTEKCLWHSLLRSYSMLTTHPGGITTAL